METLQTLVGSLNNIMWGPPMLILLVGTHLFLTFRLRLIQRHIGKGIKLSVTNDPDSPGDVSQFGALTTALAATIGTGNIVGVATAIALGGPGAVLWTWLTGVFGIATKYGEGLLALKYRVKTESGTMLGGPMYALERGLKMKWLAVLFCVFTAIAAFGIGNMTQANSMSVLIEEQFHISPYITGAILAVITFVVIIGGVKSIASVCEKLIPFMAILYVLGCIAIIVINGNYILPALKLIGESAFTPRAAGAGFIGSTIMTAARYGISRGLFSNEAGMGSAPLAAASAITRNPVRQALVSMTGVFWDTVVICAMTGLVLVTSMIKHPEGFEGISGAKLTSLAFSAIPVIGPVILTIGLTTFAYSTILGWSFYGERAIEYLLGKKALIPYRVVFVAVVFIGSVAAFGFVWEIADLMNACMAVPNLVSLLLLSPVIVSETRKYLWEGNIDAFSDESIPVITHKAMPDK